MMQNDLISKKNNQIPNSIKDIKESKTNLKVFMNDVKETEINDKKKMMDKKVKEMEDDRIQIMNSLKQLKIDYNERNIKKINENFSEFFSRYNELLNIFDGLYLNFREEQSLVKSKITKLVLSMDEKLSSLNKEKLELKNRLGLPSDRRSENLKKLNQRLTTKIDKCKDTINFKEKIIKKLKTNLKIKSNFFQLEKLKFFKKRSEDKMLMIFLEKKLNFEMEKINKVKIEVEKNNNKFESLNDILKEKEISEYSLEKINFKQPLDKFKEIEKKIYKEQVHDKAIVIKEVKKKIEECNEKIEELKDAILNNELDLKMYKKTEISNKAYMEKQEKITQLKINKINYLKDELSEYKNKTEKFEKKLQKIYKEVRFHFSNNSQNIKCVNSILRNYLNELKKRNSKIDLTFEEVRKKYHIEKFVDLKTEKLLKQYQNLLLINNTLHKRFLKIKNPANQNNQKNEKKEEFIIEIIKEEEIREKNEKAKKEMEDMNIVSLNNVKEMELLQKEMENLKNQMKIEMEEKRKFQEQFYLQKREVNELTNQIEGQKENILQLEKQLLEKEKETENKVETLMQNLKNKKKSLKVLKAKKNLMKKELEIKEEKIKEINEKIETLMNEYNKILKKNQELHTKMKQQYSDINTIFNANFEQYGLLEDLIDKEKFLNNLIRDLNKEVNSKDKKIKKLENRLRCVTKNSENTIRYLKKSEKELEETLETKLERSETRYKELESKYNNLINKTKSFEDKEIIKLKDQVDFLRRTVRDYENIIKTLRTHSETHETVKVLEKKESNLENFLDNLNNLSGIETPITTFQTKDPFGQKNYLTSNEQEDMFEFGLDREKVIVSLGNLDLQIKNNQVNIFTNYEKILDRVVLLREKIDKIKTLVVNKNFQLQKRENNKENSNNEKLVFLDNILELFINYDCKMSKDDYIEINYEKINQYLFKANKFEKENAKMKANSEEIKKKILSHTSKIRELEDNILNLKTKNENLETELQEMFMNSKSNPKTNEFAIKMADLEKKNMDLQQKINDKSQIIMDLQKNQYVKKNKPQIPIKENSHQKEFSFKNKSNSSFKKNEKTVEFSFKAENPPAPKIKKKIPYESPYSKKKVINKNMFGTSKEKGTKSSFKDIEEKKEDESSSLGSSFNDSELEKKKMNTLNFEESKFSNTSLKSKSPEKSEKEKKEIFGIKENENSEKNDFSNDSLGSIDNDSEIKPKNDLFNFEPSSHLDSINIENKKETKPSHFKEILTSRKNSQESNPEDINFKNLKNFEKEEEDEISERENLLESLHHTSKNSSNSNTNKINNKDILKKKKKKFLKKESKNQLPFQRRKF